MAVSVAGFNSDGFIFLWEHMKKHVYAVLPRTIEDLMARLQAAVTTIGANMFECSRECLWRTPVCFEVDGGRLE
jgi:hypothetical protein